MEVLNHPEGVYSAAITAYYAHYPAYYMAYYERNQSFHTKYFTDLKNIVFFQEYGGP